KPRSGPDSAIMVARPGPASTWPRSTAGSCEDVEMPKLHILLVIAAVLALIAACQRSGGDTAGPDPAQEAAAAAFATAQQSWRDRRLERLVAPDGWTSLVGLHWIEPGGHFLGSDVDNGIRLAKGPAHIGMIELR